MTALRCLLGMAALVVGASGTAAADGPQWLFERCFVRTYDAAHLARHPGQEVTVISVWLTEFEADLAAVITFATRASPSRYSYAGACFRPVAGGYGCDGCDGDGCESNGETFRILMRGKDRIDLVNQETGMTIGARDDATGARTGHRLPPGGEHGVFALSAAPAAACGQ